MSFMPDPGLPTHKSHGYIIDPKFRPVKLDQYKFILVTLNNETFTTVNISEASTLEEAKVLIVNKLNIQDWALCTFHLTEFGYKEGQSLDDSTFQQLLLNTQKLSGINDILKIFVKYIPEPGYDASTSPESLSLEYVFATNTRQYPATPGYMINQDSVDPKGQAPPLKSNDYFSSKSADPKSQISYAKPGEMFSSKSKRHNASSAHQSPMIQQQQLNKWQDYKMAPHPSTNSSRDNKTSIAFDDQTSMYHLSKPNMGGAYESGIRRSSEDSFKVIRNDRKEINFDDRRSSPYDRRPSYNPRQPSISIQTGTLTTNAAATLQKRNNSATAQQSTHTQDTRPSEIVPDTSNPNLTQTPQLSRVSSQSSRKSGKLERTPSQLVALRSAPPPPSGGGLQRANSRKGTGYGTPQTSSPGRFDPGPSAGNNITLPRKKLPGVTDSTASISRQFSFKQEVNSKRISTGPPRIDLGDFHSPGLSAELGLGLDDFQTGSFSDLLTSAASSTFKSNSLASTSSTTLQAPEKAQDEKFHENEISFENAPAFEDSDNDSSSSDEGLWAKKPPAPVPETIDLTGSVDKPKKKPDLHVEIVTPHIHGTDDGHFGNIPVSPLVAKKSGSYLDDVKLGGWAVRPPAEVVYENLERFFPDADLDRPILIDPQGTSPPTSPCNEIIANKFSYRPPLSPVPEPPKDQAKFQNIQTPYIGSFQDDKNLTVPPSPINSSSTANLKQESLPRNRIQEVVNASSNTPNNVEETPQPPLPSAQPANPGNKVGLKMRTKSLRIVVQEATERRKRFQTLANANSKGSSGALLRRKSTKMWGQKVVEVKPSEMKRGQLSRLQDNRGKVKQFVWVKGELIGKGSFGKVYLALNATAGEMIAVKQVEVPQTLSDKSSSKQKEVIDTLHAEVETMKDLDHFNIVQYLGFEALPDFYNLFLEYVPGGSVGSALRQHGRFEESVIKSFTRQVLDALSYLHSCGILHRDLKSDNLLIDLDGVCKISDFGISKKSRDIYANDAEMSMQGTIFWMAPEVIHNVVHNAKQGYSAKVDIWSLGCVVLEMFAGRRPWSTDEAIGAMYKLGNARLAPPIPEDTMPFVSTDGKAIIDQCFQIDPDRRPTASELFAHPFCEIPKNYRFQDTKLAKMIKVNDKRVGK
jgi:mitogen-activated protein kinase kinase kinase